MWLLWLILYSDNLGQFWVYSLCLHRRRVIKSQLHSAWIWSFAATLPVFVCVCTEQPGSTWCVTRCVQTQDAGVPARTSASPADTSAVDEPVWRFATFTKGELRMYTTHQHINTSTHQHRGKDWTHGGIGWVNRTLHFTERDSRFNYKWIIVKVNPLRKNLH